MSADPDHLADVADMAVHRQRERATKPAQGDATHYELAERWVLSRSVGGVHFPRFVGGAFYAPERSGLWQELPIGKVEAEVAALFQGEKLCRKAADYRGIASTAINLCEEPQFFAHAPVGVATPAGFHRIGDDAGIVTEPLTLEHRQTFALSFAPDFDAEAPLVDGVLSQAFAGDHELEQTALWWEAVGAAVFGISHKLQVVLLMLGRERSGKSLLQRLIERIFPDEAVSAVSPASWGHDYHVATLAGRRLNVVGELDESQALPAGAFKNVTGQSLITGRHPTHRPFKFRCAAAHVFASNVLPSTTDRTEGFYRRWRVLRFANTVPPDMVDADLFDKIVAAEMPALLAHAFRGAERAARAGTIRTTPPHEAVMARWRAAANPVLQFLLDPDVVELDPQAAEHTTAEVFRAYRRWASDAGFRHAFGRNHFLELLETTGASRGVRRGRINLTDARPEGVLGLRLVRDDMP